MERVIGGIPAKRAPAASTAVQRKCACGKSAEVHGECDECTKHAAQRRPDRSAFGSDFDHDFSSVPVHRDQRTAMVIDGVAAAGLPAPLKAGLEALSGIDLSDVRVHHNSHKPVELNALAYTQGRDIYLGPGQEQHLPHEGWHAVQQKQRRVEPEGIRAGDIAINVDARLESEAERAGEWAARSSFFQGVERPLQSVASASAPDAPAQRAVRTAGGAKRVNETHYQSGAGKSVGSKRSVAALIADGIRRVFDSTTELEEFANGKTDYIGDVATKAAGTFWYRLPKNTLTVLGEQHHNPKGNVEDVILGVQTSRFKYEPFNELASLKALPASFTGTESRLATINAGLRTASRVDRTKFNPDLENIVIKALTGAAITRNEFIAGNPKTMGAAVKQVWSSRASTSDYSYGERTALYLSMGIHLAKDISNFNFGPVNYVESIFVKSGRALKDFYLKNQGTLDAVMQKKDKDDLIGIYELTEPNGFKNLSVINDFTLVLHEYCARYVKQLGSETGNKKLESEGSALSANVGAKIDALSPAREEIMWGKIEEAGKKGFLLVGMGDAHRTNLEPRLNKAGIPHEEVEASLKRQEKAVDAAWKP